MIDIDLEHIEKDDHYISDGMNGLERNVKRIADCLVAFGCSDCFLTSFPDLLYSSQEGRRRSRHFQAGTNRAFWSSFLYI